MLCVGDDHDVELMDEAGRVLAKARLPEGAVGLARLHAMIGAQRGEDAHEAEVLVGIETDRGPWVAALVAAGYTVYAANPLQAPGTGNGMPFPAPRAMRPTRIASLTWSVPTRINCARSQPTAPRLKR